MPITESRKEGGWLHMRCGKRCDHVLSGGLVGQSALVSKVKLLRMDVTTKVTFAEVSVTDRPRHAK